MKTKRNISIMVAAAITFSFLFVGFGSTNPEARAYSNTGASQTETSLLSQLLSQLASLLSQLVAVLSQGAEFGTAQILDEGPTGPGQNQEDPGMPVTGTHFEAADSDITVDVSSEVTMELEVGDGIFRMYVYPSDGTKTFTVSGLAPLATLHKYVDDRHNREVLTTDEDGTLSFSDDTSNSALIWVQTQPSTVYISLSDVGTNNGCAQNYEWEEVPAGSGDWEEVGTGVYHGTWTSPTTCTLTTDLSVANGKSETIQIDNDAITLDCAGYLLSSPNGKNAGGWTEAVVLARGVSDVIVENCVIETYQKGIAQSWRGGGFRNIFRNNTISDTKQALQFSGAPWAGRHSEDNTVFGNDVSDFSREGITVSNTVNTTIEANTISNNASNNSSIGVCR